MLDVHDLMELWFHEFQHEIQEDSDLACALLGPTLIDQHLEAILRGFFIDHREVVDGLLANLGPVAHLPTRVELAFALGLIGEIERYDLHLIWKIRNEFADDTSALCFERPTISKLCMALRSPVERFGSELPAEGLVRFIAAVLFTVNALRARRETITHRQIPESPDEGKTSSTGKPVFDFSRAIQSRTPT